MDSLERAFQRETTRIQATHEKRLDDHAEKLWNINSKLEGLYGKIAAAAAGATFLANILANLLKNGISSIH